MRKYTESSRLAMYRAMKYWGKKPHNIWADLIEEYTNENDIVFDPFVGSGVSFFESLRLKRKPIAYDINPLSSFIADVFNSDYDEQILIEHIETILETVKNEKNYSNHYVVKCEKCKKLTDVYNYIWYQNEIVKANYKCKHCKSVIATEDISDHQFLSYIDLWGPSFDMSNLHSISDNTIKKFGGSDISNLWTKRNFGLLKLIFSEILLTEEPYRKILVFGFLQIVHLTSKMCSVRGKDANRPLSSSWGRPAYMALNRYMEQNPANQFYRAFYSNSGLIKALHSAKVHVGSYDLTSDENSIKNHDGCIKQTNAFKESPDIKVDFIITDPPYGNIIQYGELSLIWNIWLVKAYPNYNIQLDNEIIINENKSRENYEKKLTKVFSECYQILKESKVMIFTFNSKNYEDWESVKSVIRKSGFMMEDIYLQVNRRSSEANVSSTKGIGISDYYIILRKNGSEIDSLTQFKRMDQFLTEQGVIKHVK